MTDHPQIPPDNLVEQTIERAADKVAGAASSSAFTPSFVGLYAAAIIIILLLGSLFIVRASDQRAIKRSETVLRAGVACLLADIDDHRHTNQDAHNDIINGLHLPKNLQPDLIPLTVEQAAILKEYCHVFVTETGRAIGLKTATPTNRALSR